MRRQLSPGLVAAHLWAQSPWKHGKQLTCCRRNLQCGTSEVPPMQLQSLPVTGGCGEVGSCVPTRWCTCCRLVLEFCNKGSLQVRPASLSSSEAVQADALRELRQHVPTGCMTKCHGAQHPVMPLLTLCRCPACGRLQCRTASIGVSL